ncbi:MAG: hypothetical protein Q8N96_16105 [Methylovulum sp.]|nr:hypothetical protein [Methylovulum sp.]
MSAVKNISLTSVEDYLKWELTSEVKHELQRFHSSLRLATQVGTG